MPDLDVLRQRMEDAERRLAAAQSARKSECQGLMDMWVQIRERFQAQEQEISAYRVRLSALQDANVQLTEMVGSMLRKIEGSVAQATEDAVPTIAEMARDLLNSEFGARNTFAARESAKEPSETTPGSNIDSESLNPEPVGGPGSEYDPPPQEHPKATPNPEPVQDTAMANVAATDRDDDASTLDIPDLPPEFDVPDVATIEEDEEIARELEEIELLRKELRGLRERITSATAAE